MKKGLIVALLIALAAATAFLWKGEDKGGSDYLRVHIRADSNEAEAQAVKYRVRDRIVEYLTPVVAECEKKEEAMERVEEKLQTIERIAGETLAENGFSYGAKASLKREEFPTRVYDGVTLAAGVYDALILELGSGKGDNWWCVVYPPLCFSGGGDVVYKSKIAEIIRSFFAEKGEG